MQMRQDLIISLDCGLSQLNAVVLTVQGRMVAKASVSNVYQTTQRGSVEQRMPLTWKKVIFIVGELLTQLPLLAKRALMLTVTGQSDGTWLIDKKGQPVGNAWLQQDTRADSIVKSLMARGVHQKLFSYTGTELNAGHQSAQLLWLKKYAPAVLKRAQTAFHCKEWIYFKLTGERVADVSEACLTFGNFKTRQYDEELFKLLGLNSERRLFPRIIAGEQEYHRLAPAAARALGLLAGTPVVLAYADVVCLALAAGVYHPRERRSCSIVGNAGMHIRAYPQLNKLVREHDDQAAPTGSTMLLPAAGHLMRVQVNMAATLNFDWIARTLLEGVGAVYRKQDMYVPMTADKLLTSIDKEVLQALPAQLLYHPYIDAAGERGPFVNVHARAQFLGLSYNVSYLQLVRAVYEGVSYAARHCYETMGALPHSVYLAGEGFAARSFQKIFASVLQAQLKRVAHEEPRAVGAALIGCLALGVYDDLQTACLRMVEPYVITNAGYGMPDSKLSRIYTKHFALYKRTIEVMQPLWEALGNAGKV